MKTSTFFKTVLAAAFSFMTVAMMHSCKKDNNSTTPPVNNNDDSLAANLSESTTLGDNAYDDVFQTAVQTGYDNNIAYQSAQPSDGQVQVNSAHTTDKAFGVNGCAIYTVSPNDNTTFPKTITVDFGSGCTSATGITRKGKITYVFSGKLINPGTTVSATFTNYIVNEYQLKGTYAITNNSSLANGIAFTTQVTDGSIVFPDQSSFNYTGAKTVKQTAGVATTMDATDDVFSIQGSNSFSANGNTLVNTITTALSKAYTCKFIGSGIISFTYNSNTHGTLDFGGGGCDGDATIKIGSFTRNITFQ